MPPPSAEQREVERLAMALVGGAARLLVLHKRLYEFRGGELAITVRWDGCGVRMAAALGWRRYEGCRDPDMVTVGCVQHG